MVTVISLPFTRFNSLPYPMPTSQATKMDTTRANTREAQGPKPGITASTLVAIWNSMASRMPSRPLQTPRLTPKLGPIPHLMEGTMARTRTPHIPQYFSVEEK